MVKAKKVAHKWAKWVNDEELTGKDSLLTRCCISVVFCPLTGMCVCDESKDNHLFSDTFPGENRGLEGTRILQHTRPCTGPWLRGAVEKYNWEDRRICSLKTPDLWDRHGLKGQIKEGKQHYYNVILIRTILTI